MSQQQSYPVREDLNQRINELMEDYRKRHSKVLVVRTDVRYPKNHQQEASNTDISKAMGKTIQSFRRMGHDPAYIWVREQKDSEHHHYHCIFLLNGHKTRSSGMVFDRLAQHWGNTINSGQDGLIDHCQRDARGNPHENGLVITRAEELPEAVSRQMSYLAKPKDKDKRKEGQRDFGMSRLKTSTSNRQ